MADPVDHLVVALGPMVLRVKVGSSSFVQHPGDDTVARIRSVRIVAVERLLGDVCLLGDRVHRRPAVPVHDETPSGDGQQSRGLAAAGSAAARRRESRCSADFCAGRRYAGANLPGYLTHH
jgi:hypothetical protein